MSSVSLEQALGQAKAHQQAGQLPQAEDLCRQILAALPRQPNALHLLGVIAHQTNHLPEAQDLISQAIVSQAGNPVFYLSLGEVYQARGQEDDAAASFGRTLKIDPGCAPAHFLLGTLHQRHHRTDKAIASYKKALTLDPNYAQAHYNLGALHAAQDEMEAAQACFQKAVDIQPDYASAWNSLGAALVVIGRYDEAIPCIERALALQPHSSVYSNLGNALQGQGRIEEALEALRASARLAPEEPARLSSLLLLLHMQPGGDVQTLLKEHQQWEEQHGKPQRRFHQPHLNTRDPDRRLKIGYVSASFWNNPIGFFLRPLFENHDHANFEIFCYSDVVRPDLITERLQAGADQWRQTARWDEQKLADQIRRDGIDILVDLALHSLGNRLPVFARKPAPVQVTWLAYPSTSGLSAMDYRLTDPYLDPPGANDTCYSETSLRLPDTYWCCPSPEEAPSITPLPALAAGYVTFGSLNNFSKINAAVLTLWARLLNAVPDSRLVLFARPGSYRERAQAHLAGEGIHPERLSFQDSAPIADYFANHARTDIALDPFPWGGGTISCDALWMGVPLVTLAGKTAVGRGGVSLLSNIGLPELIAQSEDEYVRIAVELASDLPRLSEMRATMRTRMLASPLMDGPRFARSMEAAYQQMWRNWCRSR